MSGRPASVPDSDYVPRRVLTVEQAASWLGYSVSMVYRLFHDGELEGYSGPGGIRIYADAVEDFKLRYANKKKAPAQTFIRPRSARKRRPTDTQGLKYL